MTLKSQVAKISFPIKMFSALFSALETHSDSQSPPGNSCGILRDFPGNVSLEKEQSKADSIFSTILVFESSLNKYKSDFDVNAPRGT